MINNWDTTPERIKDGKPVPEDFSYASNTNTQWMSPDTLRNWLKTNQHLIGLY
jgi:hypothetical protein